MKKIKQMIESAPTKMAAIDMLNNWKVFCAITEKQYQKGRELITKEFE